MQKDQRPRGIQLQLLPPELNTGYSCAIATAPDGEMYVVCTEGVGWKVGDGFKFNDYRADEKVWSADELKAKATGDVVDLADWVRSFGSRLENNFWLWHRTLS